MNISATPSVDKDTLVQLQLLSEIDNLLRPAGIDFWLRGGWALDFLYGRLTRSHSDIDIVSEKQDASQIRSLFKKAGFQFLRDSGVQVDFFKSGQEVSIVFIIRDGDDAYVEEIPGWVWLPGALLFPQQQLNGLWCHVLSPRQLLEEKEGYYRGTGLPLRPKDRQSMERLQQLIG